MRKLILILSIAIAVAIFFNLSIHLQANDEKTTPPLAKSDESIKLMESALYTRSDFFGAQTIVPYPTAVARQRLLDLQSRLANEPDYYLKLSALSEQLGEQSAAEKYLQQYLEISPRKQTALFNLARYYHRRAAFEKEVDLLVQALKIVPSELRTPIFKNIIKLSRKHKLTKYLTPEFYRGFIKENPQAFEILEKYLSELVENDLNQLALELTREYKPHFSTRKAFFLKTEANILVKLKREREAETIYHKEFEPFWPGEMVRQYYDFLSGQDRLRAYGRELQLALKRDPGNFDLAIRLLHYQQYNESTADPTIITELEKTRAANNINWQPRELLMTARILLGCGYGEAAMRFIYTLNLQGELQPGSELRSKLLYQLFSMMINVKDQRLPLTRGDLKFYRDIATADTNPGLIGGIFSLIFSDLDIKSEYQNKEQVALQFFNRAAAQRIFLAYKQEYPTSPELAQMYLDLINLSIATNESQQAAELLKEFEARYKDAKDYPTVALKLADCYIACHESEQEREIYQRVLDYFGRQRRPNQHLLPITLEQAEKQLDPYQIEIPIETTETDEAVDDESADSSQDYRLYYRSGERAIGDSLELSNERNKYGDGDSKINYAQVLDRYVAALDRANNLTGIISLYAVELQKYPDEQGLYERLLQWLSQTNLLDEQQRIYQDALKHFPTTLWQDRLARWFIRNDRQAELKKFSQELIDTLADDEIERFFNNHIDSSYNAINQADRIIYQSLYQRAHQRFPYNLNFVRGLLKYYKRQGEIDNWHKLMAEYYFSSAEIRKEYLEYLAGKQRLRNYLQQARDICANNAKAALARNKKSEAKNSSDNSFTIIAYKLFRADAAAWLANYEEAVDAYRELNQLYPNTPEFASRLVTFTRSFGQHNRKFLTEAATVQYQLAENYPAEVDNRTKAGEIYAELGDYQSADNQWQQLIALGRGDQQTYLDTATVYWDYFQFDDALHVIGQLRHELNDAQIYAYQAGAIYEAKDQIDKAAREYINGIEEDQKNWYEARDRLQTLYARPGVAPQILREFQQELAQRRERGPLVLAFAGVIYNRDSKLAISLLKQELNGNHALEFLRPARDFLRNSGDREGELLALQALSQNARSLRDAFTYRLDLIQYYARTDQHEAMNSAVAAMLQQYPNSFGVINEVAEIYWQQHEKDRAIEILTSAMTRSQGKFHYYFARRLAERLGQAKRDREAANVLEQLLVDNRLDRDLYNTLSKLYQRLEDRAALNKLNSETLAEIKQQDIDLKAKKMQIADFRAQTIKVFTAINDYQAAIEQHIEIINQNPEDEEYLDNAIEYTKRYGGAEVLLKYYLQTAQQAYKNYRWSLVLARLYQSKRDWVQAAQQLQNAIANQPEMVELYQELADVYLKQSNYPAAIKALEKAVELSNQDLQYLRALAGPLEQAGRKHEAAKVREKLPLPTTPLPNRDNFEQAAQLRNSDPAQAIAYYRRAITELRQDPYKQQQIYAGDIYGYVEALRTTEHLDQILQELWQLRQFLISEVLRKDNPNAGTARSMLQTLDSALTEAIGKAAALYGRGDDLTGLNKVMTKYLEQAAAQPDQFSTIPLLQNISQRAGLGSLVELSLIKQKENATRVGNYSNYQYQLDALIQFYDTRGDYQAVTRLLEEERAQQRARDYNYTRVLADHYRWLNDSQSERTVLAQYYQAHRKYLTDQINASDREKAAYDPLIERYFTMQFDSDGQPRRELIETNIDSPYRYHLITLLFQRGEKELARQMIERAGLTKQWRRLRNPELTRQLRELYGERYYVELLQLKSIGQLIKQKPDKDQDLSNDDWQQLAFNYGEHLYREKNLAKAADYLPALIENNPKDNHQQLQLAEWYLTQRDHGQAIKHLLVAQQQQGDTSAVLVGLGRAYWQAGDRTKAFDYWSQLIEVENTASWSLYFTTLQNEGLIKEARAKILPLIEVRLKVEHRSVTTINLALEELLPILQLYSDSFGQRDSKTGEIKFTTEQESLRADFYQRLCRNLATQLKLLFAARVLRDSLVARQYFSPYYQILISNNSSDYDASYKYTELLTEMASAKKVEIKADFEIEEDLGEPSSGAYSWQKEYLDYLISEQQNNKAEQLIGEIEQSLNQKYANPVWLRLAKWRLMLRDQQLSPVMIGLKQFTAIETTETLDKPLPPRLERLNQAVELLRSEGQVSAATQLLRAAYERLLALEQYQLSTFSGLAHSAFIQGDRDYAVTIVGLMTEIAEPTSRATGQAKLAALPAIKARIIKESRTERPEIKIDLDKLAALRSAAQITAGQRLFDYAISYYQQVLQLSPNTEADRLELIEILANHNRRDDAINVLAQMLIDRNTTRAARWQAVWLADQIIGPDSNRWAQLQQLIGSRDGEMNAAINALALQHNNKLSEAVTVIDAETAHNPTAYLNHLAAILNNQQQNYPAALAGYTRVMIADQAHDPAALMTVPGDATIDQIVRLNGRLNRPQAVLQLAQQFYRDAITKSPVDDPEAEQSAKYFSLAERKQQRQQQSQTAILDLLAQTAEQVNDRALAIRYYQARLARLPINERGPVERKLTQLQATK